MLKIDRGYLMLLNFFSAGISFAFMMFFYEKGEHFIVLISSLFFIANLIFGLMTFYVEFKWKIETMGEENNASKQTHN